MQKHPTIEKVLEKFPGISIHSITDIKETSDENSMDELTKKGKEV